MGHAQCYGNRIHTKAKKYINNNNNNKKEHNAIKKEKKKARGYKMRNGYN